MLGKRVVNLRNQVKSQRMKLVLKSIALARHEKKTKAFRDSVKRLRKENKELKEQLQKLKGDAVSRIDKLSRKI